MTTHILSASIVHQVRAKGSGGFTTACAVVIPGPAVYVKVEHKAGQQVPTRGWLCKVCFGDGKQALDSRTKTSILIE